MQIPFDWSNNNLTAGFARRQPKHCFLLTAQRKCDEAKGLIEAKMKIGQRTARGPQLDQDSDDRPDGLDQKVNYAAAALGSASSGHHDHNLRPACCALGQLDRVAVKQQVLVVAAKFLLILTGVILLLRVSTATGQSNGDGTSRTVVGPTTSQIIENGSTPATRIREPDRAHRLSATHDFGPQQHQASSSNEQNTVIQSTAFNNLAGGGKAVKENRTTTQRRTGQSGAFRWRDDHDDEQLATSKSLLVLLSSSASPLFEYHLSQLNRPPPLVPAALSSSDKAAEQAQVHSAVREHQATSRAQVLTSLSSLPLEARPSVENNRTWLKPQWWRQQVSATTGTTRPDRTKASDATATSTSNLKLNSNAASADPRRRSAAVGDPDLMTPAASATAAVSMSLAGSDSAPANGLVHSQLPLELRAKLKQLALPQPPSIRQEAIIKRRRSLVSSAESAPSATTSAPSEGSASKQTTTETSAPKSKGNLAKYRTVNSVVPLDARTRLGGQFDASVAGGRGLNALSWQEAKRVLLMNSIAPPLVQAARRVLERRHSLSPPDSGRNIKNATSSVGQFPLMVSFGHLNNKNPQPATTGGKEAVDEERRKESSSKQLAEQADRSGEAAPKSDSASAKVTETTNAFSISADLAPLSEARARGQQQTEQGHRHERQQTDRQIESMYQIELNDLSLGLATGHQPAFEHHSQHGPASSSGQSHEEQTHIQQMAAAMLPFVWPSFQLTAGQSLGKLRARSLDARQQPPATTTTTTASPPTWPMKYQQLSKTDRHQKVAATSTAASVSAPAAASEFKPTFVDMELERELEGERARRLRSLVSSSTKEAAAITTTTTTTTTTSKPLASTSSTSPKLTTKLAHNSLDANGGRRKRRKKSGGGSGGSYLQQQQQRLERQRHHLAMKKERAKKMAVLSLASASASANSTLSAGNRSAGGHHEQDFQLNSTPLARMQNDSTRLASSQPLPRIKFNLGTPQPSPSTFDRLPGASARFAAELPSGESSPKLQIPKSLSRLIEQQLAAQSAANSNSTINSLAAVKSVEQNLILLQEYFAARRSWNASAASADSKLMRAPTTSVSKVMRTIQNGRNQSEFVLPTTTTSGGVRLIQPISLEWSNTTLSHRSLSNHSAPLDSVIKPSFDSTPSLPMGNSTREPTPLTSGNNMERAPLEPRELLLDKITTTLAPTTTTTTSKPTTTTKRSSAAEHKSNRAIESVEIVSNKILPDDEDSAASSTSAKPPTGKLLETSTQESQMPSSSNSNNSNRWHRQDQYKLRKVQTSASGNGNNIKLFHFKRKPDANKLPFYKKPLNYTELGWTAEEIEREQRRLLELQQFSGQLSAASNLELLSEDELDQQLNGTSSNSSVALGDGQASEATITTVDQDASEPARAQTGDNVANQRADSLATAQTKASPTTSELLLLKRKRRAKSQFERLMAELQAAAAAAAAEQQSTSAGTIKPVASDDQRVVPVLRRKVEPLLMRPIFFNVNQKRRQTGVNSTTTITTANMAEQWQTTATSTEMPMGSTSATSESARGKPIVRMRRKDNNGELQAPMALEPEPVSSPWRPTRPNWTATNNNQQAPTGQVQPSSANAQLVLVPSGLLTPSGTHPMPLIAATSAQQASWSPAPKPPSDANASQWPERGQVSMAAGSNGAAGHELIAPLGTNPTPARPQSMAATAAAVGSSELRVPRLLVKPMRPAKYSLNGYIPKPSLSQTQQSTATTATTQTSGTSAPSPIGLMQALTGSSQQQTSPTAVGVATSGRVGAKAAARRSSNNQKRPMASSSKDLDSSTSNEIFSRRRGIEQASNQQARPDGSLSTATADRLDDGSPVTPLLSPALIGGNSNPNKLHNLQQQRLQMEENKRKYVRQHQQANSFKSPTLTIQKANQIKAKLGLSASLNTIKPRPSASLEGGQDAVKLFQAPNSDNRSRKKSSGWPNDAKNDDDSEQHPIAASTNKISTLDPPAAADSEDPVAGTGAHTQLAAGTGSYNSIPKTDFECTNKRGQFVAGLFADVKTGCRVWHLCSNNRKYSFLCPTGTIFNSKVNSCDWKQSVKCGG